MTLSAQTNTTIAEIARVIREHDSFVLCGHVSPDGDCVGSQLALMHTLEALGKDVTCLLVRDEPLPADISFLPGAERMVPACHFEGKPQVFMGLDVPTRERVGEDACVILDRCKTSVTIDHHAVETTMCDLVYVDPDSASASMLVWELVKELCDVPPANSVLCAYTGLLTDTGGFRYQNSDANAFRAAAELVEAGADASYAAMMAFGSRTLASLKLESLVLDRMQVFAGGAATLSFLREGDFESFGAAKSDAEPMVDAVRKLAGARVVCMLREQDGVVRGSLRAKDDTDVASLARKLDGGGHRAAAGFTLHCAIDKAVELLRGEISVLLSENAVQ